MVTGLLWMGGILIALGWFAIGWVARGQENRKYAESRLRALASRAVADQHAADQSRVRWDAQRVEQPQIHVHLSPPAAQLPNPLSRFERWDHPEVDQPRVLDLDALPREIA